MAVFHFRAKMDCIRCLLVLAVCLVISLVVLLEFKFVVTVELLLTDHRRPEGPFFRQGLLDCSTINLLEDKFNYKYTEAGYLDSRTAAGIDEKKLAQTLHCVDCFPIEDPFFVTPSGKACQKKQRPGADKNNSSTSSSNLKTSNQQQQEILLIVIRSDPEHYAIRQAIRQTWLSNPQIASRSELFRYVFVTSIPTRLLNPEEGKSNSWRYLKLLESCTRNSCEDEDLDRERRAAVEFGEKMVQAGLSQSKLHLGERVALESFVYDDLAIVDNIVDDEFEALRVSLLALHWPRSYCPNIKFLASTSDDIFLFVDRLLSLLQTQFSDKSSGNKLFLAGNRIYGEPIRDVKSPYYVPFNRFPYDRIPDFVNGSFYVMDKDAVSALLSAMPSVNVQLYGPRNYAALITGFARALGGVADRHFCNFSLSSEPWRQQKMWQIQPWTVALTSAHIRTTLQIHRSILSQPTFK